MHFLGAASYSLAPKLFCAPALRKGTDTWQVHPACGSKVIDTLTIRGLLHSMYFSFGSRSVLGAAACSNGAGLVHEPRDGCRPEKRGGMQHGTTRLVGDVSGVDVHSVTGTGPGHAALRNSSSGNSGRIVWRDRQGQEVESGH